MMTLDNRGANALSLAATRHRHWFAPSLAAISAVQRVLPCARGNPIVRACQIRLGDLEIEHGLALGLVLCLDHLPCFVGVRGLQAGAFPGGLVHAVEHSSADAAAGQTITGLHFIHATARINQTVSVYLASSASVIAGYRWLNGVVNQVSVLVSVADSYATKPLPLKRFRMEAEVGIGLLKHQFRDKNAIFYC